MALRLITGRSGQGKTEYLVQEVIRLSMENPQQKYYCNRTRAVQS